MSEPIEIFEKLECNDTEIIEAAKAEIYNILQSVRDPWFINGLYDYYLNTNSLRSMEILANVNENHHRYLFDRLNESIKRQETELRVKALTLLGHIVRKQPTWIYKINEHPLMKEILYVLKTEDDILALISALLLIIVLMPMIPSLIALHLQEIFDIFSRLASWNLGTGAYFDKQMMIHMQISLYALFLRLYGMYPCNFVAYLRSFYRDKNNPVFIHTIQPMLETVRMHPRLVTASKDNEMSADRWKTKGAQQIIAECEQFYVDVVDKCPHDCCYVSSGFRSRSNTTNSTIIEKPKFPHLKLTELCKLPPQDSKAFFSPSLAFPNRIPPPTTPKSIIQPLYIQSTGSHEGTSPPEAAIEATPETTPVRDTRNPAIIRSPHVGSSVVRGLTSFAKNRSANTTPTHSQPSSPMRKEVSPFHFPSSSSGAVKRESFINQKLQKLLYERSQSVEACMEPSVSSLNVPTSPVKIVTSSPRRNDSPLSREDEEVRAIVEQKAEVDPVVTRKCDSVLHEDVDVDTEIENSLEQGSPCSQGGLHMPNSRSMNDFAKRVQRLRYHSQNYDRDSSGNSVGGSPDKGTSETTTVRRASSCPDIKKRSPVARKGNKTLRETDEEAFDEEVNQTRESNQKSFTTSETQTDSYMSYEHLFLNIFPCLGSTDVKTSPSSSPMPIKPFGEKDSQQHSIHNVLDKYMEICKGDISNPTIHIQLVQQQLLFERYRREAFSSRNRKLLADAKNVKALEEYNSALKDTIQLQQRDLDYLRKQLSTIQMEHFEEERRLLSYKKHLEEKVKDLLDQVDKLSGEKDRESLKLLELKDKCSSVDTERQQACSALFEAYAELNLAKEQVAMGEKARIEVERLNKEILLLGEANMKFQEKLEDREKTGLFDAHIEMLETSYKEEVNFLKSKIEGKKTLMDAYKHRIIDLEMILSQKDEGISDLKRNLMEVNSENYEKLKAVESKYKTQLSINRALEQKMLQLFTEIKSPGLRSLHSPETSSCHEAIATPSVSGLSPHSSPLSVSLASSESSAAFLSSDIKDMKNLQVLVDRKISKAEESVETVGENMEMLPNPSSSYTPSSSATSLQTPSIPITQQPSTSSTQFSNTDTQTSGSGNESSNNSNQNPPNQQVKD
ncbi:hamartin isoform X1 [Coccinella septempunctata]|uniref:hamartin isoform X1 n=1 Tax=Coccinella septempunctata TaxID=41139 RepID=UPI001D080494|nr:hamartin isoform X1 [Coccinella septempunctata]